MKKISLALSVVLMIVLFTGCRPSACERKSGQISLASCLAGLTNESEFARSPAGYAGMESSYDRTGGNNDWMTFGKPDPDGLYTIARLTGPGCVTRIWMTSIVADEWLFFFDGESRPRIRAKGTDFFGKLDPFLPPLNDTVSAGNYSYMPIPYSKSLRIAVVFKDYSTDMRPYFHVNYRTYPPGTQVESFPTELSQRDHALVENVRSFWRGLANPGDLSELSLRRYPYKTDSVLKRDERILWVDAKGPAEIVSFAVSLGFADSVSLTERSRALRDLVLRIYWNGASRPSVEAPLGDFFCNPRFQREYGALPMSCVSNTYVCRFPMPFGRSARGEIVNQGDVPVRIFTGCDVRRIDGKTIAQSGYFHAGWRQLSREGAPFRILNTEGSGRYVGCFLTEIGIDGGWNMFEGDENIIVDNGKLPGLHGTGMEDYFNGAWYYSGLFDLPLHGLIEKAPIRSSQYRFHLADVVTFDKSISVDFEFGDANRGRGYMSGVAYWYQSSPVAAGEKLPEARDRVLIKDPLEPASIMGRLIEIDRIGHYAEGRDQSLYYAEQYSNTPLAPLLRVRAEAYRELAEGWTVARPNLVELARTYAGSEAGKQAELLLWFHDSPTNALLGIHPMGRKKVFLDGVPVAEGDSPAHLMVFPVTVCPGEHELAVELSATKPDGQMSLYLRMHSGNIQSDPDWEYVRAQPAGWPATTDPAANWMKVEKPVYMVPSMRYWQFMPNGFPNMQAGRQLIRPWDEWLNTKSTVYLRRKFTVL